MSRFSFKPYLKSKGETLTSSTGLATTRISSVPIGKYVFLNLFFINWVYT